MATLSTLLGHVLVLEEQLKAQLQGQLSHALQLAALLHNETSAMQALLLAVEQVARPVYERAEERGLAFAKEVGGPATPHVLGVGVAEGLSLYRTRAAVVTSSFITAMRGQVKQMSQAGIDGGGILARLKALYDEELLLFGALNNGLTRAAAAGVQQSAERAYLAALAATPDQPNEGDNEWVWVTVQDNHVCPECETRHNEVHSLVQWRQAGLPKSGFSRCDDRCRCFVMPEQFADEELDLRQPVKLTPAMVQRIGDRAAGLTGG